MAWATASPQYAAPRPTDEPEWLASPQQVAAGCAQPLDLAKPRADGSH